MAKANAAGGYPPGGKRDSGNTAVAFETEPGCRHRTKQYIESARGASVRIYGEGPRIQASVRVKLWFAENRARRPSSSPPNAPSSKQTTSSWPLRSSLDGPSPCRRQTSSEQTCPSTLPSVPSSPPRSACGRQRSCDGDPDGRSLRQLLAGAHGDERRGQQFLPALKSLGQGERVATSVLPVCFLDPSESFLRKLPLDSVAAGIKGREQG